LRTNEVELTAVLPLRIDAQRNTSDLDRLAELLLPSLEQHWRDPERLELLVITPPADVEAVRARISRSGRLRTRVLSEDAVSPSLQGEQGWHKQQILKLAAARVVTTPWYLTLDADVILRRPLAAGELIQDGRAPYHPKSASRHWAWWTASRAILRSSVALEPDSRVMDVTPEVLHRETALTLLAEVGRRNGVADPDRFLFDARELGWTEYSLYWLFVLEQRHEPLLYRPLPLYEMVWRPEHAESLMPDPRAASDGDVVPPFLVVQSTLEVPPATLAQRLRGRAGATSPSSAARMVWAVWAAALVLVLAAIIRYGRNVPFEEDWLMVPAMTGHEADLPGWLWSQNSEHRLPLPRLVNLALLRSTGDFRATMLFNALALAAVAAALIGAARRIRGGRLTPADAFFPLLLLHLGNWDNLVWAWQIQFVLPTALVLALLAIIVSHAAGPPPVTGVLAAMALAGLPLSGANGLLFAPPLAAWFGFVAWQRWRAGRHARGGAVAPAAGALATLLLCAVYFVGYQSSPWNEPSPGVGATLLTTGKFLALGFGPWAAHSWVVFGSLAVLLLGLGVAAIRAGARERRDERIRVAGLVAFCMAIVVLALAIGWGRAGRAAATGRVSPRYVLLAAPGMCMIYFALLLYGRPRLRRAGPAAMAVLLLLLYPLNTWAGLGRRDWFGAGFAAFEHDLAAGASPEQLAERHHRFMLHWDSALMASGMRMLRDARIGPFLSLREEGGTEP
jgi:hypothetical protein